MLKKALIEWHYLPSVQYISKFLMYEEVFLENCENYRKGSYRNRCYIAGANGPLMLTIPLRKGKNEQQIITEVQIAHEKPWQHHHWYSIQSAYGNAPFFLFYKDEIAPLFREKPQKLVDWHALFLHTLLPLLGIRTECKETTEWAPTTPQEVIDLRNCIHPKPRWQKEDPHWNPRPYPQVFMEKHGFLPNLSILDLLFCTGPEALSVLEASCIQST